MVAAGALASATPAVARETAGAAPGAASAAATAGTDWELATTTVSEAASAPAYVGNGYVGTRVPADGAGYVSAPVTDGNPLAGVYADVPDPTRAGSSVRVR